MASVMAAIGVGGAAAAGTTTAAAGTTVAVGSAAAASAASAAAIGAGGITAFSGASLASLAGSSMLATAGTTFVAGTSGGLLAGLTTSGVISSVLTAASVIGGGISSIQQSKALNAQARQSELNARLELLKGKEAAGILSDQYTSDLAATNALFAARGITTSEGSAEAAIAESRRLATEDINATKFGSELNAAQSTTQAQVLKSSASGALQSGVTGAFSSLSKSRSTKSLLSGIA